MSVVFDSSALLAITFGKDLERQRARDAAAAFRAFLDAHPGEQAWLAEWDGVDLAAPPARKPGA